MLGWTMERATKECCRKVRAMREVIARKGLRRFVRSHECSASSETSCVRNHTANRKRKSKAPSGRTRSCLDGRNFLPSSKCNMSRTGRCHGEAFNRKGEARLVEKATDPSGGETRFSSLYRMAVAEVSKSHCPKKVTNLFSDNVEHFDDGVLKGVIDMKHYGTTGLRVVRPRSHGPPTLPERWRRTRLCTFNRWDNEAGSHPRARSGRPTQHA